MGRRQGKGRPSGENSIGKSQHPTLTCPSRKLKGAQHNTAPLPTPGVLVTSLTLVGKKEVSLLENSVPSSGSTNLNASEWRVRLPWRPSPHGLAGNLNCGSLLWASLGLISSPQVLAPSPLVPAGGSLDTLQIPLQLCAVWGIWGEAWHIPEQMELVGGWGWGELVQLQQGLGDHEQRKQMETTDLGLTLLCWVWIQF